ncbi:Glutamyl-tRNA(Gln) amidotransferase subunit A [Aquicella siphonis]|uniref:Glutamyl-tRNA(Gln) amidotransferase subunit A n=1 Tax=Aquicella siphonis TaxID=254247 RepID=A0A5E4PID6_9COXI|nr:Asp-tRNA(Asn)/Glu-tRNA(Gln) amidotransferase subunit GatA [Aquicella siphonis]VVC76208.1 Glutamyl-tRNA(Gln) amidotransferase subunit A [Aquicella siphonis]
MHHKTITELSRELDAKKISSVELTQLFMDRIHRLDKQLNSFVTITEEHALQAARKADDLRAQGKAGPLTGIPIAHKDIFCTDGIKTSCGSKMLDNFISPYDATVVRNLKNAGTVMLGKTNMDEFAMGSSNETSYYGPVRNPWNLDYVPGGSSGGSSAAVAAGLAPGATGTDTGGSIRQPAALCGITGIKPTYGRVSRYGMIAFASSLDQGGPLAKTVEDCAHLLNAMSGFDERDSTSVDQPVPDYTASLNDSIKGVRIGLPKEYFSAGLSQDVAAVIQEAIREYEKLGAVIEEISLPNTALSVAAYYVIAPAECSSNLARYDGVRYGYRCENPADLQDLYKRSRSEGFGSEVKRRIMIGTYVLSAGYYDAYYLKAQKVRRLIRDDFVQAFKKVDVILSPTAPTPAFRLGEKTSDPISMYLSDIYTIAINLAGLPGISVPAGFVNRLPIGMQLIGNLFGEARLLNIAHQYQKATDWHKRIPEGF